VRPPPPLSLNLQNLHERPGQTPPAPARMNQQLLDRAAERARLREGHTQRDNPHHAGGAIGREPIRSKDDEPPSGHDLVGALGPPLLHGDALGCREGRQEGGERAVLDHARLVDVDELVEQAAVRVGEERWGCSHGGRYVRDEISSGDGDDEGCVG
jgi:hypothetical protein